MPHILGGHNSLKQPSITALTMQEPQHLLSFSIADTSCDAAARGFDDSTVQLWVESLFVFSMVWSVGATGDTDGREAFDTFFRYTTAVHSACLLACCLSHQAPSLC